MFEFTRDGLPLEPVLRPGSVAVLDRVRDAIGSPAFPSRDWKLQAVAREVEAMAAFVSPVPIAGIVEEQASIALKILEAVCSQSLRHECCRAITKQAERLIELNRRMTGPGSEELRDGPARTAVEVAAGSTC